MKTLMQRMYGLFRDEEGTEVVEWALVAGLIIIVAAGAWATIGGDVGAILEELATAVGNANPNAAP
jgi:pilus assembly protein Flp/PilA